MSRVTKYEIKCKYCNNSFTTDNVRQKYCSHGCYAKDIDKKVVLRCQYCGKEKKVIASVFKKSKKICKQCFSEYCKTISDSRKKAVQKKAVTAHKACVVCGAQFEYRVNQKIIRKICSIKCTKEFNAIRIKNITVEQRLKGIKTRSETAGWKAYKVSRVGKKHPNYKGGKRVRSEDYALKKWRKDVYLRDDFTCQHCHEKSNKLEAHHILHWAEHPEKRYDIDNGITLCYDCHNKLHGKVKKHRTFHCEICGKLKTDGRSKRCRKCAQESKKNEK